MKVSQTSKKAIMVAGGTGGHINTALAVGHYFQERHYHVQYMTGQRPLDRKLFPSHQTLFLDAVGLKGRSWKGILGSIYKNIFLFFHMIIYFKKNPADFIFSAGGYVGGPVCLAAFFCGIPIYLLEQNSVFGLTNRLLAYFAKKIFLNFRYTEGVRKQTFKKVCFSGNPIRRSFLLLNSSESYRKFSQEKKESSYLHVLVFGGSLGATSINECCQDFIKTHPHEKIWIRHQLGGDHQTQQNISSLQQYLQQTSATLKYEPKLYLEHIVDDFNWADVVLCRAGASSLSELRVVKKPVVLIPYPFHKDRHQFHNAQSFQREVSFPVLNVTVEDLKKNNYECLKNFFQQSRNFYAEDKGKHDEATLTSQISTTLNEELEKPLSIVFREIDGDVSAK